MNPQRVQNNSPGLCLDMGSLAPSSMVKSGVQMSEPFNPGGVEAFWMAEVIRAGVVELLPSVVGMSSDHRQTRAQA